MGQDRIIKQDHRLTVFFAQIESPDRFLIDLFDGIRHDDQIRMISMRSPFRLHDVGLGRQGCRTAGRTLSHDIDNDARDLVHISPAEILLHQRKTRTAGSRHRLLARTAGTDHRTDRREFIFHLHKHAIDLRQQFAADLRDLGCRSDRIARKKTHPASDCCFCARLIACHDLIVTHCHLLLS